MLTLKQLLKDTTIVIPSSGRPNRQQTLSVLPPQSTILCIPEKQRNVHSHLLSTHPALKTLWCIPDKYDRIHLKRKYLIENCKTRFLIMLDDDLKFFQRADMTKPKLDMLTPVTVMRLLSTWRGLGNKYAHVGLSDRSGNNHYMDPIEPNYRINAAYLYDVRKVLSSKVELARISFMEDFDLTLQLLRMGIPNCVMFNYAWNQIASGAKGGCSTYRTAELQAKCAHALKKFHPEFVRIVEKQVKTPGWWEGMQTRTDVRVDWKKAYKSSQRS